MINRSRNHLSSILGDAAVIQGMLDAEVTVPAELEARVRQALEAHQAHHIGEPESVAL